jgi:hypothetical protein
MRHHIRYTVGGLSVAVMIAALVGSLEIQFATARPSMPGAEPTNVNRMLKGNRLPSVPGPRGENPADAPKMPKGCEATFSSVRNIYANEIAGRCVAAAPMGVIAG